MIRVAVRRVGLRLSAVALFPLLAFFASSVAAQVTPPPAEELDSARLAILERLERLARPPGYDSVLFLEDSLRVAEAAEGNRFGGAGMDSVATALLGMPGYDLVEYEAESADFAAQERILVLRAAENGRARVSSEGLVIEADTSITFNEATGRLRTVGEATFTPPEGDPIVAVDMIYDLAQGRGSALDAKTSWTEAGANWTVRGDMPYAAQDSTFMSHARFTSCEIEEPHYHFEANEIKIVAGNVLVARGVKLYFADVPVMWLPFIAQSLSRGRSSGILTPRFSVNDIVRTSGGYRRRVSNMGFYWAMNDYSDALVAMDWFSETFFSLTSSFRYRFRRQFLDGHLSVRRFWREDGSTELAIDTRHSWEIDERTQLRVSGRFVSNNDFVRENSFNPQEVTQSIDSEAGINRRFGWGSLSLSANRKQFLSDDRTEWLLPSANLSLSPITFFRAPSSEARFWNNMTWSGSGGMRRNTVDRLQPDTFAISQASTARSRGFARSNLSLGNLTFSQSVDLSEAQTLGVPEALLLLGDDADPAELVIGAPVRDIAEATLGWSASLNYQQRLIGSTTITPRLSLQGNMFRSDTDSLAPNFVSAPSRIAFGAQLRTDIYGFYGGVGPFEAVRHKISPSFDYAWSPESAPSALQQEVFGSRALQPKNTLSISLTQTIEAKRRSEDEEAADSVAVPASDIRSDTDVRDEGDEGPQRVQQTPSVTLLAWRMSVVKYDFVEADSVGLFLAGFETTRLGNQFSSDYLRGLSISMDHEIFEDDVGDDGLLASRRFRPHLSQVNLAFSFGSSSSIFRWLSFGGGQDADEPPEEPEDTEPLALVGATDESTVVPVMGQGDVRPPAG
ncbi:MAG: LPS-assembly protein LptD, partial [Gemmatimonadetes bacterium]|nr:LPS-assembly protein LptD [Gemmatimonadota bacterium]